MESRVGARNRSFTQVLPFLLVLTQLHLLVSSVSVCFVLKTETEMIKPILISSLALATMMCEHPCLTISSSQLSSKPQYQIRHAYTVNGHAIYNKIIFRFRPREYACEGFQSDKQKNICTGLYIQQKKNNQRLRGRGEGELKHCAFLATMHCPWVRWCFQRFEL